MCNPMRVQTEVLVAETLNKNLNEKKDLYEWLDTINSSLPKPKRLTRSSFAHSINDIASESNLNIIKEESGKFIYYLFQRL